MTNPTPSNEQRYYDALVLIAKGYDTVARIRASAARLGLTDDEALQAAYENIQFTAANAIFRRRRPKS